MNALYPVNAIRIIEKSALASLPVGTLMQRAGAAAATTANTIINRSGSPKGRVLVLAGPGNNGGDALETAANLANSGHDVTILMVLKRTNPTEETSLAMKKAAKSRAKWEDALSLTESIERIAKSRWTLAIDGIFGIGLNEGIKGNLKELVLAVNRLGCPILALDVPSGLDVDTGTIVGGEDIAIKATHTITFIGDKPGLHTAKGRDYAGIVTVADLAVEKKHFIPSGCFLNHPELFQTFLKPRAHDSHKGTYGRVGIIGGDNGMGGALTLASRTALMMGSGFSYAIYIKDAPAIDPICPEVMIRLAHRPHPNCTALAIGPGLGQSHVAYEALQKTLSTNLPLVIDADALNLIAANPALKQILLYRKGSAVITPHPLEAARLLETDTATVQSDRIKATMRLATQFNVTAVLKGSGTVICSPEGSFAINPTGNPALATAGSGDVLTGMIVSFLAQGWRPFEAACGGVYLHGLAADNLVKRMKGYTGLTASEIAPAAREALNALTYR